MSRKSRIAFAVGLGWVLGTSQIGSGQGLVAPAAGADLERLSKRLAEALRDLGDDLEATTNQTPAGQYLVRDTRELQRAANDWYGSIRGTTDPYQIRRSFSGIEGSWHRLGGQLAAPGAATPAVAEEARRVEQLDTQIHDALGLNAYPAGFAAPPPPPTPPAPEAPAPNVAPAPAPAPGPGPGPAPNGPDETRRLAYTLAQRGEALASTIQASYGSDPNAGNLVNDAAQLARLVDGFYDGFNNPNVAQQPDYARQSFPQVIQQSNALGISLGMISMPPPIKTAWDDYTSVHNLLRVNLGLTNATPDGQPVTNVTPGIPDTPNPSGQVARWADELDRQVDDLSRNFVRGIPEVQEMLVDIERMRNDVRNFRGDAAQGLDPSRLAYEFRDVDADWQRLSRRINRVARNAFGPNVQRIQRIGQTCDQIHRALGMPGYAPVLQPF